MVLTSDTMVEASPYSYTPPIGPTPHRFIPRPDTGETIGERAAGAIDRATKPLADAATGAVKATGNALVDAWVTAARYWLGKIPWRDIGVYVALAVLFLFGLWGLVGAPAMGGVRNLGG